MLRTVILGCLLVPCFLFAQIANPNVNAFLQRSGTTAFNVTNYGYSYGGYSNWYPDVPSRCTAPDSTTSDFPSGSGQFYMFQSALWIGAEIREDTTWTRRVSVGVDGWFSPSINELYPGETEGDSIQIRSNLPWMTNCAGESLYDPNTVANLEAIAVYSDTLTDPFWLVNDPIDGPHRPLGIQVTQKTMTWFSPDFSDFMIMEFTVQNISDDTLWNPVIGWFADLDARLGNEFDGHVDDLAGTIPFENERIAWIADNDGRAANNPNGPLVLPHAFGTVGLSANASDTRQAINWWMPNGDMTLDFGPAWIDSPNWTENYGSPVGDLHRYQVLAGREFDYDQVYVDDAAYISSHPQFSIPPCELAGANHNWRTVNLDTQTKQDYANGFDTRYLITWGPLGTYDHDENDSCVYRLAPAEEFTVTTALIYGRNFHDVNNPQPDPEDIDPSLFDYSGLITTAGRSKLLYDQNYTYQPPVAPEDIWAQQALWQAVPLEWVDPPFGAVAGFHIYGTHLPDGVRTQLNSVLITGHSFTVNQLNNGDDWLFEAVTVDNFGYESEGAKVVARIGAIAPVTNLTATVQGTSVHLSWDASSDPTLVEYWVHRRAINGDTASFGAVTNEIIDSDLIPGRFYDYWVTAHNNTGIDGLPSDTVRAVPWQPQTRLLVLDEFKPLGGVDFLFGGIHQDSITNFYTTLLGSLGLDYEYITQNSNDPINYSLETLAGYDVVLWHNEGNNSTNSFNYIEAREAILEDYVRLGGKLLRVGRQLLLEDLHLPQYINYSPNIFSPLLFDSAFVPLDFRPPPGNVPTIEFTGAISQIADFPSVEIDTAKTVDLLYGIVTGLDFLPEAEVLWPHEPTLPLYRIVVTAEDSSGYENQPCGVIGENMIVLTFPLYFLQQDDAAELLTASVNALRFGVDVPDEHAPAIPNQLTLSQNYPNPFNPTTTISFSLPQSGKAELKVYDIMGRTVETLLDGYAIRGEHKVEFNATTLASGIYFYRLESGNQFMTRKMILLK